MRIAFLLGSGVSLPAGLPSTRDLTLAVMTPSDYYLHSDECFYRGTGRLPFHTDLNHPLQHLKRLLTATAEACRSYFDEIKNAREANYEDLYFALSQTDEHLGGEYENPAIEPFVGELLKRLPGIPDRAMLRECTTLTLRYIEDVIALQLSAVAPPASHLICLIDALRDPTLGGCNIFTLNHDTLIEAALDASSIPYTDGFGAPNGDIDEWRPAKLRRTTSTRLLKLHGSVNWRSFGGRLAKVLVADYDHAHGKSGRRLPLPSRPRCLIGTFNKIRDYSKRPYFDLWFEFRRQLDRTDLLIVSGYSFGDKGVNGEITWWMGSRKRARLLVLHEGGEGCIDAARGAIGNLWDRYAKSRFLIYPKYLQHCCWEELRQQYAARD